MKKLYILAGAFFATTSVFAQAQSYGYELFFSGYNEGAHPSTAPGNQPPGGGTPSAGTERALQIFNPTVSNVDMGQYSVARYSNGSTTVFQEERCQRNVGTNPNNTLSQGDVFVISANAATLPDILNNADQITSPYGPVTNSTVLVQGGPVTFDGNDAMVLRRWTGGVAGQGTPIIVDIIGVIGENPAGGAWFTNTTDPVTGMTLTVSTAQMSLRRKSHITGGTTTNPNPATYEIGDEWEVYSAWNKGTTAADYFAQDYTNLAGHASFYAGDYGTLAPVGRLEDFDKGINVYPNPVGGQYLTVKIEKTKVGSFTILNALGQNIKVTPTTNMDQEIKVDVSSLKPGAYFVKFVSGDEYRTTIYKRIIVQ